MSALTTTVKTEEDVTPGARLLAARRAAGLSQEKLARLADCSTSTVRIVERGYLPSAAMRARLALAAGTTAGEVWPDLREVSEPA